MNDQNPNNLTESSHPKTAAVVAGDSSDWSSLAGWEDRCTVARSADLSIGCVDDLEGDSKAGDGPR